MESGWRVKGFDGEWMEGGGFRGLPHILGYTVNWF